MVWHDNEQRANVGELDVENNVGSSQSVSQRDWYCNPSVLESFMRPCMPFMQDYVGSLAGLVHSITHSHV